jgi:hypothetical protein
MLTIDKGMLNALCVAGLATLALRELWARGMNSATPADLQEESEAGPRWAHVERSHQKRLTNSDRSLGTVNR